MRWWPRSIRWQLLAGLVLLEVLSLGLFGALLIRQQAHEVHQRMLHRLEHQASSMALQATEALQQQRAAWVGLSVRMMGEGPSVAFAKVTDPAGNVIYVSEGEPEQLTLDPAEKAQLPMLDRSVPRVFAFGKNRWESVKAIVTGTDLRGYAWVETDREWDYQQLDSILRSTVIFGIIWIASSIVLVLLMARSISRPLAILSKGTRALMSSPEQSSSFPLPVVVENEIGDLIEAFNRMVASIDEQRSGLNDTLSLLDSMLANAPIGLAFFDRRCRFVRVNQVFADLTGVSLSRHLGRTLIELLPPAVANELEATVARIFTTEEPVRNLELSGDKGPKDTPWTWLVSAYPVKTPPRQVRWAGVIVLDASDRKRSEEALRRTEKLAATGRLAASIAHEINNPLEAITNLLFLLRNFCSLQDPALNYVVMAEHEAQRIAEITQQTLRFYRQSTQPTRASMSELLGSVLSLYHGRLNTLGIHVERGFDPEMDLFCFAGELRQVFANLVGNAIDATAAGGRLVVRARRSRNWGDFGREGVRFVVADTGTGMDAKTRERIFEAFFTTKEVVGTGLGLWVSYEIIVKHHGFVRVRSRVVGSGKASGTVFAVFIPDDSGLASQPFSTIESGLHPGAGLT
jgi:PAS domain S-box-containing protein